MDIEEIIDKVRELDGEWMSNTNEPGIYRIIYDPDNDSVYFSSTFSGDNSYVENDNRIVLVKADVREYISNQDMGLDENGIEIEGGAYADYLEEQAREALAEIDS